MGHSGGQTVYWTKNVSVLYATSAAAGMAARPGRPLPGRDLHPLELRTFHGARGLLRPPAPRCQSSSLGILAEYTFQHVLGPSALGSA